MISDLLHSLSQVPIFEALDYCIFLLQTRFDGPPVASDTYLDLHLAHNLGRWQPLTLCSDTRGTVVHT